MGGADAIVSAACLAGAGGLWVGAKISLRRDEVARRLEVPARPTREPRQHFTVLRFYDQDAER
jgi:hypothetical protein